MLWIAIVLPDLALQVSHRGLLPDLPLVVSDGALQRPLVVGANPPAQAAGICAGMPVAAAQALVARLIVQPRDAAREQAALHALATWATQFTPTVSLDADGVLLEVQASLRLFGGLAALGMRIEDGARRLGFTVAISVAPTPMAALLFARLRAIEPQARGCTSPTALTKRLAALPLTLFGWPASVTGTLAALGIGTIGACRALPRDGLIRRFGVLPVNDLDRADGTLPDPRSCFMPPERFYSKMELAAELSNLDWIALPVRQLLAELEGYLRARRQGTQQLLLTFEQGRQLHFTLRIETGTPCCFADEFATLVQEQLARTTLNAPVQAIALQVDALLPYLPHNAGWLPDGASQTLAWSQLCDRLQARLPARHAYRIAAADDHRPERAWRREEETPSGAAARKEAAVMPSGVPRPAWLLPHPQALAASADRPHFEGPLRLLTEPERIEAGWWDDHAITRDYYVATTPAGRLCWIFRNHAENSWYLHGFFA